MNAANAQSNYNAKLTKSMQLSPGDIRDARARDLAAVAIIGAVLARFLINRAMRLYSPKEGFHMPN